MNHPGEMNCPLDEGKAAQLINALDVPPGGRVVDVGCGTGVFLARVIEQFGAEGKGVDVDVAALSAARNWASERNLSDRVDFAEIDIRSADFATDSFDAGICLGASHAYASGEPAFREALAGLSRIVRDGGTLLVGEGYWKQSPTKEYLAMLGEPVGIYRDHAGNVALAESMGLTPLLAMTASVDEWDVFEWRHHRAVLAATEDHTDDESQRRRQRAIAWRNAYLQWGRETMGFGYYLFRNTKPA